MDAAEERLERLREQDEAAERARDERARQRREDELALPSRPSSPAWVELARQGWTDINAALAESSRATRSRFSQPRVRSALQRAARLRPSWFQIRPVSETGPIELAPFGVTDDDQRAPADAMTDGHGLTTDGYEDADQVGDADPSRTGTMTPQQRDTLQDRARRMVRELEAAIRHAREAARTEATQAGRDLANMTEGGLTAILRPLSNAFATATAPAQRGAGFGLGLGLVLAALILLK
jgi:hypothetical protein